MFNGILGPDNRIWLPEFDDLQTRSTFLAALNQASYTPCRYFSLWGTDANLDDHYSGTPSSLWWLLRVPHDGLVEAVSGGLDLSNECIDWEGQDIALNHDCIKRKDTVFAFIDAWLGQSESSGGEAPAITVYEPEVNQDSGSAYISGVISGLEFQEAVVIHNGRGIPVTVGADGAFRCLLILQNGLNTVAVRASNSSGTTTSDEMVISFSPPGNESFHFRVTLFWDGYGDVDLHTWDPNGAHSYYGYETIGTGELDYDNTYADGPENFTCRNLVEGRYRVAVNSYDRSTGRNAYIRVTINNGDNAGESVVFGPYQFTTVNGNTGYPVVGNTDAWWRPCDIVVFGSSIRVVNSDGEALSRGRAGNDVKLRHR